MSAETKVAAGKPTETTPSGAINGINSWFTTAVGIIALVSLLACLVIPFWVLLSKTLPYDERLASHRIWLSWATAIHLVSCATWIVMKNK